MGIAKKCLKFVYKDGKTTIKRNNIEIANDIEPDEISDYIDELQKDSKKKGKSWDQYLDEIAENKSKTKPSKIKDPLAKPRGNITKIPHNTNMANKVSLELENEAAEILAKEGYDIEQNPIVNGTLKNPDYKIEGEIFDCYSPFEKNKSVRGIWFEVENKVLKGQTKRVVLNLKNWEGDITKLQKQFSDWEIENLQEVMYITKNAKINHIKITK